MRLGYVIVYVPDVLASVEFYERAFGLTRGFVAESGEYGQMDTGETALGFASEEMGASNLPDGFRAGDLAEAPANVEVGLVDEDVAGAFSHAVQAGATAVAPPAEKPWGQTVAYVRDPDGTLVELASPMGG